MKVFYLKQKWDFLRTEYLKTPLARSMVVGAMDERHARMLADTNEKQERKNWDSPWMDNKKTDCVEMVPTIKERIICINMPN